MTKNLLVFSFLVSIFFSCSQEPRILFQLLPPEKTGIDFQNDVQEDEYLNILSNEYIYNGAGVGIGDLIMMISRIFSLAEVRYLIDCI